MKNNTEKTKFLNNLNLVKKNMYLNLQNKSKIISRNLSSEAVVDYYIKANDGNVYIHYKMYILLSLYSRDELLTWCLRERCLPRGKRKRNSISKIELMEYLKNLLQERQSKEFRYVGYVLPNLDLVCDDKNGYFNTTLLFHRKPKALKRLLKSESVRRLLDRHLQVKPLSEIQVYDAFNNLYLPLDVTIELAYLSGNVELYHALVRAYSDLMPCFT